jgi:hypothetical protein
MKSPFKRDAGESVQAARAALSQTEEKILGLESERGEKLSTEGDYAAEVATIDRQLVTLRANAGIHRDRIAAMAVHRVEQERGRRAEQKAAGIIEIKKRLARRHAAADKLDQALKLTADAFTELSAADDALFANWPDMLLPVARVHYLRSSVLDPLSGHRKPRPMAAGAVREIAARVPFNFAATLEEKAEEMISELEQAPIPEPRPVDEEQAA